jgi:hypothetical protein
MDCCLVDAAAKMLVKEYQGLPGLPGDHNYHER